MADSRSRRFCIFTGNHDMLDPIEDYLAFLEGMLANRGYEVRVDDALDPGAVNIVIDEFSDPARSDVLRRFKSTHPGAPVIFLLTEFCERRFGFRTFNHFSGLAYSAALSIANVLQRRRLGGRVGLRGRDFVQLGLYLPLAILDLVVHVAAWPVRWASGGPTESPLQRYRRRYRRAIYMHSRYLGFICNMDLADGVMSIHEQIEAAYHAIPGYSRVAGPFLGVIAPEINARDVADNLMRDRDLAVELTGSVTTYRERWIRKFDALVDSSGLSARVGKCRVIRFGSNGPDTGSRRAAYSLHPPQDENWPYCSPTRIYRALVTDRNVPVITRYYGQSPIENLCLRLEGESTLREMVTMFDDREKLLGCMNPRLKQYEGQASRTNDLVVRGLLGCVRPTGDPASVLPGTD